MIKSYKSCMTMTNLSTKICILQLTQKMLLWLLLLALLKNLMAQQMKVFKRKSI